MKIKTNELTNAALDWAVAKCEGGYNIDATGLPWDPDASNSSDEENGAVWFRPSVNWSQGGPIIERERIDVVYAYAEVWEAKGNEPYIDESVEASGPTPLIAAMRCFVASKLGNEVDVPDELVKENEMNQRPLTVAGLIDYLNQFPGDTAVFLDSENNYNEVNEHEDGNKPYILLENIDFFVEK